MGLSVEDTSSLDIVYLPDSSLCTYLLVKCLVHVNSYYTLLICFRYENSHLKKELENGIVIVLLYIY